MHLSLSLFTENTSETLMNLDLIKTCETIIVKHTILIKFCTINDDWYAFVITILLYKFNVLIK